MDKLKVPVFILNEKPLVHVKEYNYLGVMLFNNRSDNYDISIYTRSSGNIVMSKFKKCSQDIKVHMFKTYCSSL